MKIWTEEELINDGYRLRNAEITNVSLNMKDYGALTLGLSLSGGGWGVDILALKTLLVMHLGLKRL